MAKYRDRPAARDFIRAKGIKIGENALKDHASRGTGPAFKVINGRALYLEVDLLAWIDELASRPCGRGRRHKIENDTAAAT